MAQALSWNVILSCVLAGCVAGKPLTGEGGVESRFSRSFVVAFPYLLRCATGVVCGVEQSMCSAAYKDAGGIGDRTDAEIGLPDEAGGQIYNCGMVFLVR